MPPNKSFHFVFKDYRHKNLWHAHFSASKSDVSLFLPLQQLTDYLEYQPDVSSEEKQGIFHWHFSFRLFLSIESNLGDWKLLEICLTRTKVKRSIPELERNTKRKKSCSFSTNLLMYTKMESWRYRA